MEYGVHKKKNILILSSPNPYKTAGIVALTVYEELKQNEHYNVEMLVGEWDNYLDPNIFSINTKFKSYLKFLIKKIKYKLVHLGFIKSTILNLDRKFSIQDFDQTNTIYSTKSIVKKIRNKPDIVLIIFMQNFISFNNLFELNKLFGAKNYLYLMDMAPFTGACHYAWTCLGYMNQCGKCPGLYSSFEFDQSFKNWKYKYELVSKTDLEVLVCSDYTLGQAVKSSIFKNKTISKVFLPIEKYPFVNFNITASRLNLNLPSDKIIYFFGANSINDERKGYKLLLNSLEILSNIIPDNIRNNVHLAIAGRNGEDLPENIKFGYTYLGFLNHETLKIAFASADFFISPSIEDSGPMMVNQSLVRGTPVISFKMGVALDLIENGRNGFLAELGDVDDLVRILKISMELDRTKLDELRANSICTAEHFCSSQKQVNKILDIIK